jgi:hypothetical protein
MGYFEGQRLTQVQVLSIACDNASNNDVMIAELAELLPGFSVVNQMRCFLHVVNLIAHSLVRQFNVLKAKTPTTPDNDPDSVLRELTENIDVEDQMMREALLTEIRDGDDMGADAQDTDDNIEGWVDEIAALLRVEHAVVEASLHPIHLLLVKVSDIEILRINGYSPLSASQTRISDHPFDHNPPSPMEKVPAGYEHRNSSDAT